MHLQRSIAYTLMSPTLTSSGGVDHLKRSNIFLQTSTVKHVVRSIPADSTLVRVHKKVESARMDHGLRRSCVASFPARGCELAHPFITHRLISTVVTQIAANHDLHQFRGRSLRTAFSSPQLFIVNSTGLPPPLSAFTTHSPSELQQFSGCTSIP
jgi:hypothetical protein